MMQRLALIEKSCLHRESRGRMCRRLQLYAAALSDYQGLGVADLVSARDLPFYRDHGQGCRGAVRKAYDSLVSRFYAVQYRSAEHHGFRHRDGQRLDQRRNGSHRRPFPRRQSTGTVRNDQYHRLGTPGDHGDRVFIFGVLVRRTLGERHYRTAANLCNLAVRLECTVQYEQSVYLIRHDATRKRRQARFTGSLHQAQ